MEIYWHALLSSKYLVVKRKQLNMYRRKETIQLTKKNKTKDIQFQIDTQFRRLIVKGKKKLGTQTAISYMI